MKTIWIRKVALFFLLGSTVLGVSPRVFANDGPGQGDGRQERREEQRSDRESRRNQEGKACRNMHPELQIAEPFNRSQDSEQGE
jgi:hypothetical protein